MYRKFCAVGLALVTLVAPCFGQAPVQSVDLYGVRAVSAEDILEAVSVEIGKPLSEPKNNIVQRVRALDGVVDAHVAPISTGNAVFLFVGIREMGSPSHPLRAAPTRDLELPAEIIQTYDAKMRLLVESLRRGQGGEEIDQGHSLSRYEPMRELQLRYLDYSEQYFLELVDVLHESRHAHHRAVAATVLAYVEDKSEVVEDLVSAASDPDATVRNNATRALAIFGEYSQMNPDVDLEIPAEPFLRLIESLVWTDRNKGSATIDALTARRDPELLAILKQRSVPYLEEMARWHSVGHASFALQALARVAGVDEETIETKVSACFRDPAAKSDWVNELIAGITRSSTDR